MYINRSYPVGSLVSPNMSMLSIQARDRTVAALFDSPDNVLIRVPYVTMMGG